MSTSRVNAMNTLIFNDWAYEIIERHSEYLILEKEGMYFKFDRKNRRLEKHEIKKVKSNQKYAKELINKKD